ncbi:MAG: cysteine desulfurase family protein [Clostridia bacterium]
MNKEMIYLDNAATTNIGAEVLNAMVNVYNNTYGNSSSIHSFGREASNLVDESRDIIAESINAKANEIYFTGSGSEANSWAIIGLAYANQGKGYHIITSKIEHPSVLEACKYLEHHGFEVTYLNVDRHGFINFAELMGAIKPSTILISIMSANNELGTIQNIKAIAHTAHESGILFHTDAVQLYGHMQMDVEDLGIDAMTISAHKIYGPKGVGALYVSNRAKIQPIIFGGNQERSKRGGTTNTAGIVGFAKASEVAYRDVRTNNAKLRALSEYFITQLTTNVENVIINGDTRQKLPHIISATFIGVDGESLLMKLDMNGVAVSTGSACSTNSISVSHVMQAIGLSNDNAKATIRFSLGKNNSYEELDKAVAIIKRSVDELRSYSSTYGMKIRKRKGGNNA